MEEDRDDHAVRGPAMHVSQQLAEDDDCLEVLDVGVGVVHPVHGRVVIEHEERPSQGEDEEEKEGQPAHAPRVGNGQSVSSNLDRVKVQEDVRENGERLVLAGVGVAVAEERSPDVARLGLLPDQGRYLEH